MVDFDQTSVGHFELIISRPSSPSVFGRRPTEAWQQGQNGIAPIKREFARSSAITDLKQQVRIEKMIRNFKNRSLGTAH
ncbi:hypothetical protein ABD76_09960 [Paenibacillus dendritiformis]|nr:hypothetical protein [Paenibacillus dendritiformis]